MESLQMDVPRHNKRKSSLTPGEQVPVRQRHSGPSSDEQLPSESGFPQISISPVQSSETSLGSIPPVIPGFESEESDDRPQGHQANSDSGLVESRSDGPNVDYTLPETVTYSLHITFDGEEVPNNCQDVSIHPYIPSSYDNIKDSASSIAKTFLTSQHGPTALINRFIHFRHGHCIVTRDKSDEVDNAIYTRSLSCHADWEDIFTKLKKLGRPPGHQAIHLNVYREYFGLITRKFSEEAFADTKRKEIWDLMKKPASVFGDNKYLPRSDLSILASMEMVRGIVTDDPTILPNERESFIHNVYRNASKLLIMCVLAYMPMNCLKTLLERDYNDSTNLEVKHRCHKHCAHRFELFLRYQGGLKAPVFAQPGQHHKLPKGRVVPIHYCPQLKYPFVSRGNAVEETSENEVERDAARCGSGAYSNVYRVRLDPAHHSLAEDKDTIFALKVFIERPRNMADFEKERNFLSELFDLPHKHIVSHLATWTQNEGYYMLFPYAECNLRQYMIRGAPQQPTKRDVLWLQAQFKGLSDALRLIHNLDLDRTPETSTNLQAPQQGLRKSGWHHDLKPENILYFKPMGSERGLLKIADFGSGKVHTYRSGSVNTRSPNGTLTYEPPEAAMGGPTSRPYDVWSMGCVFLEMLIWATFGSVAVDKFSSDRVGKRFPDAVDETFSDDAFWQLNKERNFLWRSSVGTWFSKLEENSQQQSLKPFRKVVPLIRRMLDTNGKTRIIAVDVANALDAICLLTKADLKHVDIDSPLNQITRVPSHEHILSTKEPDRGMTEPDIPTINLPREDHASQTPRRFLVGDPLTDSPEKMTLTRFPGSNNSMSD